jgi:hypothetical protein
MGPGVHRRTSASRSCATPLAERLADMLQARFYADYGIVVFVVDAAVLRPGKF